MVVASLKHAIGVERETALPQQRHLANRRALDTCGHGIHAKGWRTDDDIVDARTAESAHQQVDGLIAAAAGKDLLFLHAVKGCQALGQRLRMRFRITIEPGQRPIGLRSPGQFIGVQPFERRIPTRV